MVAGDSWFFHVRGASSSLGGMFAARRKQRLLELASRKLTKGFPRMPHFASFQRAASPLAVGFHALFLSVKLFNVL